MKVNSSKTALVTGGSKGIGSAICIRVAKLGYTVYVHYNSDIAGAESVVKEIEAAGGEAHAIKADLNNRDEILKMVDAVKGKISKLDLLVCNAGVLVRPDGITSTEAYRRTFEVNLFAHVDLVDMTKEMMTDGNIIFTSSVHGGEGRGNPGVAAYSASKAAMNSYFMNLAKELAPTVRVNAVAPGRTLTPMWGDMDNKTESKLAQAHLTERWVTPDDIADGVVFLVDNESMCGHNLVIDGGMSLRTLG